MQTVARDQQEEEERGGNERGREHAEDNDAPPPVKQLKASYTMKRAVLENRVQASDHRRQVGSLAPVRVCVRAL